MRNLAEFWIEFGPVLDTILWLLLENLHVRSSAEETALQRVPKSIVDRQRNHQRHHAGRDSDNRNHRDHRDNRLLALGPQIAAGDEKLKPARATWDHLSVDAVTEKESHRESIWNWSAASRPGRSRFP